MSRAILIIVAIIIFLILIIIGGVFLLRNTLRVNTPTPEPTVIATNTPIGTNPIVTTSPTGNQLRSEGVITEITQSNRPNVTLIKILPNNSSVPTNIEINPQTVISDESGRATNVGYLQRGFTINATGQSTEGAILATSVQVTKAPNIVVYSPQQNQSVGQQFTVTGIARVFENVFQVRLINNKNNQILFNQNAQATGEMGTFSAFSRNVSIPVNANLASGDRLTLDVFEYSARDGSEINKVTIPLTFRP